MSKGEGSVKSPKSTDRPRTPSSPVVRASIQKKQALLNDSDDSSSSEFEFNSDSLAFYVSIPAPAPKFDPFDLPNLDERYIITEDVVLIDDTGEQKHAVRAGSWPRFVYMITHPEKPIDKEFLRTILYTYPYLVPKPEIPARNFLSLLRKRWMNEPIGVSEDKKDEAFMGLKNGMNQEHVKIVLEEWLSQYSWDFKYDPDLLNECEKIINDHIVPTQGVWGIQLKKLVGQIRNQVKSEGLHLKPLIIRNDLSSSSESKSKNDNSPRSRPQLNPIDEHARPKSSQPNSARNSKFATYSEPSIKDGRRYGKARGHNTLDIPKTSKVSDSTEDSTKQMSGRETERERESTDDETSMSNDDLVKGNYKRQAFRLSRTRQEAAGAVTSPNGSLSPRGDDESSGSSEQSENRKASERRFVEIQRRYAERRLPQSQSDSEVSIEGAPSSPITPRSPTPRAEDRDKESSKKRDKKNSASNAKSPSNSKKAKGEGLDAVILGDKKLLDLSSFQPDQFAQVLTHIEHNLFLTTNLHEYLFGNWKRSTKEYLSPNIVAFINWFNRMSDYFVTQIVMGLTIKRRVKTLKCLLNVAMRCKALNNFNTAMEIVSALNKSPVERLKMTWKELPEKYTKIYAELIQLLSPQTNYAALRSLQASVKPGTPCLPYLGIMLQDLLSIEEIETKEPNGLINFKKIKRLANAFEEIRTRQKSCYVFDVHTSPSITTHLTSPDLMVLPEDDQYKFSHLAESRDQIKEANLDK